MGGSERVCVSSERRITCHVTRYSYSHTSSPMLKPFVRTMMGAPPTDEEEVAAMPAAHASPGHVMPPEREEVVVERRGGLLGPMIRNIFCSEGTQSSPRPPPQHHGATMDGQQSPQLIDDSAAWEEKELVD